ncbi:MAG: hypothetical protein WCI51_19170, partial [Lentisphaerota bacterium]
MLPAEIRRVILCAAENLRIGEQDCELDFFAPTDRRCPQRMKDEWKKTAARRSPQSSSDLFNLDSHS